nr:YdcF family protein [Pseudaminobacter soli]
MMKAASRDSGGARGPGAGRALRVAAMALLAGAIFFVGGFGLFATYVSELETPREIKTADGIIVLTGGQARLDAALELLKSGKGRRLLISGVHPDAGRDSLRRITGGDKDLFACCVDIDHAALDTIGNAEESAKWVQSHAYERVILVTSNYHMPRSLLEIGRLVERAKVEPYPVVNTPLAGGGWLTKPAALRVIFTEYTKYVAAVARSALPAGSIGDGEPRYTATIVRNTVEAD